MTGFKSYATDIPDGLYVLHTCDSRRCVNPAHLYAGTQRQNMGDMKRRGRANGGGPSGEKHHNVKLTDAQVREIRRRFEAGAVQSHLADEFGISGAQVGNIVHGKQRVTA